MLTMVYCMTQPRFLAAFWTMCCALVLLAFGLYLDAGTLGMPQPTVGEWVLSGFSAGSVYLSAYRCLAIVTVVVFFFRTLKKMQALIDDHTKVKMRDGLFRWSYMLTMTLFVIANLYGLTSHPQIYPQIASPARDALQTAINLIVLSFAASDIVCLLRWRRYVASRDMTVAQDEPVVKPDEIDERTRGPLARGCSKLWRKINPPMESLPAANAYSLMATLFVVGNGLAGGLSLLEIGGSIVLLVGMLQFFLRRHARSLGLRGNATDKEMNAAGKARRDATGE